MASRGVGMSLALQKSKFSLSRIGPLGDMAIHRMTGYDSLAGLVLDFLDPPDPAAADEEAAPDSGFDSDRSAEMVRDLLSDTDPFRVRLAADVSAAVGGCLYRRRVVMGTLRAMGYNAGVCEAAAGGHEYVDVVAEGGIRYVVELDFAGEFEIARPTAEYRRVAAALPAVAVARDEVLRGVVRTAAEAAKRSLRRRGLHEPPWRKGRYMMAKWFGPYKRTVNFSPAAGLGGGGGEVECRFVGFQAFAAPPVARTR